jgi:hypothetical protein
MDVIKLFQSKNRCLGKFHEIAVLLADQLESGNFQTLKDAEAHREAIIKTMELYDRKIAEAITLLDPKDKTDSLKALIQKELDAKTDIIHKILKTENRIVVAIENEKVRIQKELAVTEKNKNTVKKFKSGWVNESGEGVDTKL